MLYVSENEVLRKIFVSNKDEVSDQCGILLKEECCDLYRSPSVIMTVKSR